MKRRDFLMTAAGLAATRRAASGAETSPCACTEPGQAPQPAPTPAYAGNWRLIAYDAVGQPLPPRAFDPLLITDLLNNPSARTALQQGPPEGPFLISLPLPIPGFGHVYLFADNGGAGYRARDVAGRELLLNFEFSRSRIGAVERYLQQHGKAGFRFSAELDKRLDAARAAQRQAEAARADATQCARLANESLADSLWAGEMAVFEKARQEIEKRGNRPGFLFGCNGFAAARGPEYTERFAELLNFATVPFYRAATEKEEGKVDYSRAEFVVNWLARAGIKAKGHPLVWFHQAGMPAWLKDKDQDGVRKAHRDYIVKSVTKFRPWIPIWDVINEAHDHANILNYTTDQLTEMTRLATDTVRLADPTAFRVVNCCCTWSENVVLGRSHIGPTGRPTRSVLNYVKDIIAAGVQFEALGLQLYWPNRDMFEVDRQLELFAALGKPIHITELGISSDDTPVDRGEVKRPSGRHWHGDKWTETVQADWVEQFYTIAYSKPYLDALTWWDFSDPAFIPHGGFLTPQLKPKESFHRLLELRKKWQAMA